MFCYSVGCRREAFYVVSTWRFLSLLGLIEAEIPIAEFRKNRRIPRYPLEVVQPVFDQYVQEVPLNHLDIPADELPQTREDMQALLDRESRWLN